jgi:hypothetical protein
MDIKGSMMSVSNTMIYMILKGKKYVQVRVVDPSI